jgi:hypothetical protein
VWACRCGCCGSGGDDGGLLTAADAVDELGFGFGFDSSFGFGFGFGGDLDFPVLLLVR